MNLAHDFSLSTVYFLVIPIVDLESYFFQIEGVGADLFRLFKVREGQAGELLKE